MKFNFPSDFKEPYRIFFPIGILCFILSLILWLVFYNGWISFYPRRAHASLMFFGFFWSFIAGFFMTAIPRMTSTLYAQWYEVLLCVLTVIVQVFLCFLDLTFYSALFFILQNIFLVLFLFKRFLIFKKIPFEGFVFLPFSFFGSFLGVGIFLYSAGLDYSSLFLFSGEAFIFNLILGIGSRLIPVISRIPGALMPDIRSQTPKLLEMIILALFFNGGFYIQFLGFFELGLFIRFIVILYFSIFKFKLFHFPWPKTNVGYGIKLSILLFLISYVAMILFPLHILSIQHIFFIGGFTLITLMIATRVMLAHGEQSLEYEVHSKLVFFIMTFLLLSSILRVFSFSNILSISMKLALYFSLVAVILWLYKFLRILMGFTKT